MKEDEKIAELLMQSDSVGASVIIINDYAKQQSIEFAEWMYEQEWNPTNNNKWYDPYNEDYNRYTTEQLYQQFKKKG